LGRVIGGPSRELPSKSGQKLIQQLIPYSIHSSPQVATSFTTTCPSSTKVYSYRSKEISTMETEEFNLPNPTEAKVSFSNVTDGKTG
jgi:hypothetical protein